MNNNPNEEQKREIDALIHDVPSSTIPLDKPAPNSYQSTDLVEQSKTLWGQESRELLVDFDFGLSLGKFGDNDLTTDKFLKRLREALVAAVTHVCNKENHSSENFRLHYAIVDSILALIAKEIESQRLTQYNVKSILAVLHGFFESYISEVITKKQRRGTNNGKKY